MDEGQIRDFGEELFECLRGRHTTAPLTERAPGITIDDAYRISLRLLELRLADGERVIGKKIGVTSDAVQDMLGVRQPDFGFLTDRMLVPRGEAMRIGAELIQPRAEGEIAFRLARDLNGPGVMLADVLAAAAVAIACFEVVDSRIDAWRIRIQDTIADNASCGLFILGDEIDPRSLDLAACEMVVDKNGAELSRGFGAAVQGSPLHSVAWLANTLGRYGTRLDAGDIVLSGSLVPLEPVVPGDRMSLTITGLGGAEVDFS